MDAEIALLEPLIGDERMMEIYLASPTEPVRNEIIGARLYASDLLFSQFETALMRERRDVGFLTTLAELAVGATGSFVNERASQILSALSAGIAGASESFDKEILIDQTIQALLTQMRANRAQITRRIYERMALPVAQYPLTLALKDLEDYYQGGTLVGALVGINESAGLAVAVAEGRATAMTESAAPPIAAVGVSVDSDQPPPPQEGPRTGCGSAQTVVERQIDRQICVQIQQALCVDSDGVFGDRTREAFQVIERSFGLAQVDGLVNDEDMGWFNDLLELDASRPCRTLGYLSTYERVNYDPVFDSGPGVTRLQGLRNNLAAFWANQTGEDVTPPTIPDTPQLLADLRNTINATQAQLREIDPASPFAPGSPVSEALIGAIIRNSIPR